MAKISEQEKLIREMVKKPCADCALVVTCSAIPKYDDADSLGFVTCMKMALFEGKIININDSLDTILYSTDVCHRKIKLPYSAMFINKRFQDDNLIINGISVINAELEDDTMVGIIACCVNEVTEDGHILTNQLVFDFFNDAGHIQISDIKSDDDVISHSDYQKVINLLNKSTKYVSNFVYMLAADNEVIRLSKSSMSKRMFSTVPTRIDRTKMKSKTFNVIMDKDLKRYIKKYNKSRNKLTFKLSSLINGHFKTTGEMKWIPPFIEGNEELENDIVIITNECDIVDDCIMCGSHTLIEGDEMCIPCHDKIMRKVGICVNCGKLKKLYDNDMCLDCWNK